MPLFERVRKLFTRDPEKRVREIAKQIESNDDDVRWIAAHDLGKTRHPAAIPHLAKLLREDWNWNVRGSAATALANIAHPNAILPLVQALQDKQEPVRSHAIFALGKIGRKMQGLEVEGKEAKALQLVGKHFQPNEELGVIRNAYQAAFEGKITEKNAGLYVKQLRALKGKVK